MIEQSQSHQVAIHQQSEANIYRALAQQQAEIAAVIAETFSPPVTLDHLYHVAPERLAKVCKFPIFMIERYDPDRDAVVLVGSYGLEKCGQEEICISLADTVSGEVIRSGTGLVSTDIDAHPNYRSSFLRAQQFRAYLGMPIMVRGVIVGVISLVDIWPRQDVEQFVPYMQMAANYLAQVIQQEFTTNALIEQRTRLQSVIDNNLDCLLFLNSQMQVIDANPEALLLLGYPKEKLVQLTLENLIPDCRDDQRQKLAAQLNAGGQVIGEAVFLHQDGALVEVDYRLVDNFMPGVFLMVLRDISDRKRLQEALERRLTQLTAPVGRTQDLKFSDLFDLEEIQHLQDAFALATGVASVITDIDGIPITQPSNFCRLCENIIRDTPVGLQNCMHSDAFLGRPNDQGPTIRRCLSGGLWDAGASIHVGERHVANWLIGQVIDREAQEENVRNYVREIGGNEEELDQALREVTRMPVEQFKRVAEMLFLVATHLSKMAVQNVQQAREISRRVQAEEALRQLNQDLQIANHEMSEAYEATIRGWSKALELRDKETRGHSDRVVDLSLRLAREFQLDEAGLKKVLHGALLHDIGKMGVPDSILLKVGPLNRDEWVIMRQHPEYAYQMLSGIPYLQHALDIPLYHHEKWDGTGYPFGLKGEQIPLAARIFAVVDVWDALCSDRPYRPAWPEREARRYLNEQRGHHFDALVVDAFLRILDS